MYRKGKPAASRPWMFSESESEARMLEEIHRAKELHEKRVRAIRASRNSPTASTAQKAKERRDYIRKLREEGSTIDAISTILNISKARVHQILAKRSDERPRTIDSLGVRATSVIRNHTGEDTPSPDAVAKLSRRRLAETYNCGPRALYEIEAWLAQHGLTLQD